MGVSVVAFVCLGCFALGVIVFICKVTCVRCVLLMCVLLGMGVFVLACVILGWFALNVLVLFLWLYVCVVLLCFLQWV